MPRVAERIAPKVGTTTECVRAPPATLTISSVEELVGEVLGGEATEESAPASGHLPGETASDNDDPRMTPL